MIWRQRLASRCVGRRNLAIFFLGSHAMDREIPLGRVWRRRKQQHFQKVMLCSAY